MRRANRAAFYLTYMTGAVLAAGLTACHHDFGFFRATDSALDATADGATLPEDANLADQSGSSLDADVREDTGLADAGSLADATTQPTPFHRLAVGGAFACAIHGVDHVVNCFGDNEFYQLGIGAASSRDPGSLSWTRVIDGTSGNSATAPFANADSLSAGTQHACALRGNDVFCWGQDDRGETGKRQATTAQRVLSASDFGMGLPTELSSGDAHICVVLGTGVVCWGANDDWQVYSGVDSAFTLPVSLPIPEVQRVGLGTSYSLALLNDGSVLCWGNNDDHQCGSDPADTCAYDLNASCVRIPRKIPALGQVGQIAAGAAHACAVDGQKSVWCWGANDSSQVGIVHPACRFAYSCLANVTPVDGIVHGADQLALGARQSCALVHRQVFCWGMHFLLGQNEVDSIPSAKPAPVLLENESTELTNIVEIAAGDDATCALDQDGDVYCWGILAGQTLYGARRISW